MKGKLPWNRDIKIVTLVILKTNADKALSNLTYCEARARAWSRD